MIAHWIVKKIKKGDRLLFYYSQSRMIHESIILQEMVFSRISHLIKSLKLRFSFH